MGARRENYEKPMNELFGEFDYLETTFVEALKLNAEEHCRNVGKYERFVLFNAYTLHVTHLVVADEHVRLRCDMEVFGVSLVVERHDFKHAV